MSASRLQQRVMRRALHLGRSLAMLVAHRALDAAIAVIAAEERARDSARRVALAFRPTRRPIDALRATERLRPRGPDAQSALELRREAPVALAPLDAALFDVEGLLSEVRSDLGCSRDRTGSHRACRAIGLLGTFPLDRPSIAALEETVTAPRRPECVQRAAIDALSADRSDVARRALARMENTVRVRAEWSADRDVTELATRIGAALGRGR